jgi:hypothetical protein
MLGLTAKTVLLFHLLYLDSFSRELASIFLQYFFSLFLFFLYYLGQELEKKWFKNNETYIFFYYTVVSNIFTYAYLNINGYNNWISINLAVHIIGMILDLNYVFGKWFKRTFVIELPDDRVYQHVY